MLTDITMMQPLGYAPVLPINGCGKVARPEWFDHRGNGLSRRCPVPRTLPQSKNAMETCMYTERPSLNLPSPYA
jgi:hypothetical protein